MKMNDQTICHDFDFALIISFIAVIALLDLVQKLNGKKWTAKKWSAKNEQQKHI